MTYVPSPELPSQSSYLIAVTRDEANLRRKVTHDRRTMARGGTELQPLKSFPMARMQVTICNRNKSFDRSRRLG